MSQQAIYIDEDNLFRWDLARKASNGSYINSGSGSWDLRTGSTPTGGTSVSTGTLAYVTSSNGRWQGTIDKTLTASLTEGQTYYLFLYLSDGLGADGTRRIECVAQYQGDQ